MNAYRKKTPLLTTVLTMGAALSVSAQIVTLGLEANHHADPDGGTNGTWENDGGLATGIDRLLGLNAVYRSPASTLHRNLVSAYDLQGGNTNANRSFRLSTVFPDSYGEVLGNPITQQDATFEIWFKPPTFDTAANNNDLNMRYRVLWETGGGIGTGMVIHGSTLCFASRSAGNQAIATVDLAFDLGLGPDEFIQAVGIVRTQDDFDIPDGVQLFVNGQLVSTGVPAPAENLTDWDGGDGDAIGGRGGGNLGGYGNGFVVHDPDGAAGPLLPPGGEGWRSFGGEIGIYRWYSLALTPEEVLQNFEAVTGNIQIAQDLGEWDLDADLVWEGTKPPATGTTVLIGGGFSIGLFSEETVEQLVLGHQSGTELTNGTGTLNVGFDGTLNAGSVVLGGSGLPGTGNNLHVNDAGTVNVSGDIIYGLASDQGGNIRVHEGGTLNVTGSITERIAGVNTAQLYLNGGTFSAGGDITVQSFRTGDSNGSVAEYTQPAPQTITNTGTFFAGNNGLGTHIVDGGTLLVDNSIRVAEQGGAFESSLVVNSGTVHNRGGNNNGGTNKQLDIGRRADGTVVVNGGTFTNDAMIRFGHDAPTTTSLTINGGTFIQNGDIITGLDNDGSSTSSIVVNGGTLDVRDNATRRSVTEFTQTGGDLLFRIRDTVAGPQPIEVADFLTFTTTEGTPTITPTLDLPPSVNTGESDTWTGPGGTVAAPVSGVWDTTNEHWETTTGSQLTPATGGGALVANTQFTLFTAALINDFANVVSGDPLWALTSDGTSVTATYNGDTVGSAMPALIAGDGVVVTRNADLHVAPNTFGVDTTQLNVDTASLLLTGNSGLSIGGEGNAGATVNLENGAVLTVGGDLVFGPSEQRGGTLNINGGSTLNVAGNINETVPTVPNAQLQINAGTLDMTGGGSITVQRFSVGEAPGSNASYTAQGNITATGTFNVAGSGDAIGVFTLDNPALTVTAANISIGQGLANNGTDLVDATLNVIAGNFGTNAGNLNIAGDNQGDTSAMATAIFGDGTSGPTVNVSGGNSEWGHGGTAVIEIKSGDYNQNTNNIVIAQGASANSTVTQTGGTVTTAATSDLNFNRGIGVLNLNGGNFNVGRNVNLGNNTGSSDVELNIAGGNLSAGQDLSYRNNGVRDVVNLSSGSLSVARNINFANQSGGGGINEFNQTGGVFQMADGGTFNGDYTPQGGTFRPGAGVASVSITGNYTGSANATLEIDIDWDGSGFALEGVNNDFVQVGGDFDIGGASLSLNIADPLMATADLGSFFIIVDGVSSPVGTFAQGNTITVDGFTFTIDYGGNSGDDIELILTGLPGSSTADGDKDGLVELLETAFGTDANDSKDGPAALPVVSTSGDNATITFRRLTTPGNITYKVQQSTDLINWTDVPGDPVLSGDQSGLPVGVERVETSVSIGASGTETYLRVMVTEA